MSFYLEECEQFSSVFCATWRAALNISRSSLRSDAPAPVHGAETHFSPRRRRCAAALTFPKIVINSASFSCSAGWDNFSKNWFVLPARLLNWRQKELVLKEAERIDYERDYSDCIDFRRTRLARLDKKINKTRTSDAWTIVVTQLSLEIFSL